MIRRYDTTKAFVSVLGWFVVVLIPTCHIIILWNYWSDYSFPVNRESCTCSCWDTVFKGPYESGVSSYKDVYFNATRSTMRIWLVIVTGVILLYETVCYLVKLFLNGILRQSMALLAITSLFPHYYSWWAYFNYYNDHFYDQWNHQMFFTVTELASTLVVLYLANLRNEITERKALIVVGIALIHIYGSGVDQFILNVIYGEGEAHQVVRDLGFMGPDLLHTIIPVYLLIQQNRRKFLPYDNRKILIENNTKCNVVVMSIFVLIGCFMLSTI